MVASILLFVVSLTQDCFYIDRAGGERNWALGLGLLLFGWIAVLLGVSAWLANPLLAIAWCLMGFKLRIVACGFAILSLGFALGFLLVKDLVTNEGGGRNNITGYGAGYWFWVGSIVVALIGCIVGIFSNARRPASVPLPLIGNPDSVDAPC